jgi:hypothetical protein
VGAVLRGAAVASKRRFRAEQHISVRVAIR